MLFLQEWNMKHQGSTQIKHNTDVYQCNLKPQSLSLCAECIYSPFYFCPVTWRGESYHSLTMVLDAWRPPGIPPQPDGRPGNVEIMMCNCSWNESANSYVFQRARLVFVTPFFLFALFTSWPRVCHSLTPAPWFFLRCQDVKMDACVNITQNGDSRVIFRLKSGDSDPQSST